MKERWIEMVAVWRGRKNAPSRHRLWHFWEVLRVLFTRLPQESGQAVVGGITVILVLGLVVAGGAYLIVQNSVAVPDHAIESHGDGAIAARAAMAVNIQDGNPGVELYYSLRFGKVLGIVRMGDNSKGIPMCSGVIWRIDDVATGQDMIADGDAYECTAFYATCSYWNRVIRRDRYVPIAQYPNTESTFIDWFRKVVVPQYP